MAQPSAVLTGRTSVEQIVDKLYDEIIKLRLLPGEKISESEIAQRFGVSRQPVRDAFSRLALLDLVQVRPQRATTVKRFSARAIQKSRFIRSAVEAEVLRRAAARCDEAGGFRLDAELAQQRAAAKNNDYDAFARLDYDFHETLCKIAQVPFAFDVVSTEKAKVDRLCMLSLTKESRIPLLITDHEEISNAIKAGNGDWAVAAGMLHLTRLDTTIETVRKNNETFFEPDDD